MSTAYSRRRKKHQIVLGPDPLTWPPEAQQIYLELLAEQQAPDRKFKAVYRNNPAAFARDCIQWDEGEGLAPYQLEILEELPSKRRVAVRGPHGLGKTCIASISLLCFATTWDGEDWKVPTTASAWRQLTEFFWPEVHKWARRLKWDKIGRQAFTQYELQNLLLKLTTGRAFAMASSEDEMTEGAHASHLLYVFDEAKVIPAGRWDAAEGALSTGDCYALAISTPGEPQGRFYDIHSRKPGYEDWWVRHVTVDECIAAGRINEAFVEQRRRQWGEQSAVFKNRVLGEFCESDEDCVIPLAWIEAANERWAQVIQTDDKGWHWRSEKVAQPLTALGVDIARSDLGDKTVIARRQGDVITQLDRYSVADTMPVVGYTRNLLTKWAGSYAVIDVIGIGAGPYDKLREDKLKVHPFNASEATEMTDRSKELQFANKRAAAWWNLRELLDPAFNPTVALPPDDLLTGDLTAPRRGRMTSAGKLTLESKDEIRKRLGRSTDDGDAVVMAFFPPKADPVPDETYSFSYTEW